MTTAKIQTMTMIALMTALICILGPLALPIGPVPISLTPLAVFLSVYILGMKRGGIAYILYLLIGLVGLPVFSGASGGPQKLFGPTGGYLFGFAIMAFVAGFFIDRYYKSIYLQFLGMLLGLFLCYIFGSLWLSISASMTLKAAVAAGVLPFVILDIIKIVLSIILGRQIRNRLSSLHL